MAKKHTIQVLLSDAQYEAALMEAGLLDVSVSAWAARRLFPGEVLCRAKLCEHFSESVGETEALVRAGKGMAGRTQVMLDVLPYPELELHRLLSGAEKVPEIWEVRQKGGAPLASLSLHPDSRFLVGGSPWPYRVIADYSSPGHYAGARAPRIVLAMQPCHEERAFLEVQAA